MYFLAPDYEIVLLKKWKFEEFYIIDYWLFFAVAVNGHQEEGKEDEPEEEDPEEEDPEEEEPEQEESEQQEAEDKVGQTAEGEEPVKTEDNVDQPAEDQEPAKEPLNTITEETDPTDSARTNVESADNLVQPNSEVEEPSELPREGDIPVHSDERQAGSDAQILSRQMEVPNDKVN